MADPAARVIPDQTPPQPVEDQLGTPAAESPLEHEGGEPRATAPHVEMPVAVENARDAMAARFQRRRAENRAAVVPNSYVPFADGNNPDIPGYIGSDEEIDAAATAREEAESAAVGQDLGAQPDSQRQVAPPASSLPLARGSSAPSQNYTLNVDQVPFSVTREQLLQYAEIDPAEAQEMPDHALIRLAQKQIAANKRLDQARQFREDARAPAYQQDNRQAVVAQTPVQPGQPDPELVAAIEEIQFGDPQAAAQKLTRLMTGAVTHGITNYETGNRLTAFQQESGQAIAELMSQRSDIFSDPIRSMTHVGLISREIADDLAGLGLIDQATYNKIALTPQLAAECQRLALAEGKQVRRPAQVIAAATQKLDQAFQRSAPPSVPTPSNVSSRVAAKRLLPQTPARSGTSQVNQNQEPVEDARVARQRQIIRNMSGRTEGFRSSPN